VLTLLRRASDLDIAIESRAFGAPVRRTSLEELTFNLADYVVMAGALAVFVGMFLFGHLIPQFVDLTHG
jgi:energy-coupling factor transporter transmembrane protein EcfT